LATTIDARVHCAVLKIRAVPVRAPPHPRRGEPVLRDGSTPVPSGPNSVLDQAVTAATLPVPRDRTNWVEQRSGRITKCSTDELPSRDVRPRHGSGRDLRRDRASCSLERR